jgi:hypothetical protein
MASRLMPQFDGLGGQGVAKLVGVRVSDAGGQADPAHDAPDAVTVEGTAPVGDQSPGVVVGVVGPPSVEEVDQEGV